MFYNRSLLVSGTHPAGGKIFIDLIGFKTYRILTSLL